MITYSGKLTAMSVTKSHSGPDVAHPVDVALGQLVDADLEIAHGLRAEPVRADRAHLAVVRVVHVDQGAQPDAGLDVVP